MSRTGSRNSDAGFTLLELLVLLALLSIVTMATVVWVPGLGERMDVARAADLVERVLMEAATDASTTGRERRVLFRNGADRSIVGTHDRSVAIDGGVSVDWETASEAGGDRSRGVIVFFGAGGASGGRIEITKGHSRAAVEVDWLTGKVRRAM